VCRESRIMCCKPNFYSDNAGFQHNVSILNLTLSHIFRKSTFDGSNLNVFHFGMRFVDHIFGHSMNYILNKFSYELQIVFSA
jgi:hypothetical protein